MRIWCLILTLLLAACASSGVYHPVKKGQTLYRISRTYGVEADRLMAVNGIRNPSQLKAGSMLYIPGARTVRNVPVTVTSAPKKSTRPTVKSRTTKPAPRKTVVKPRPKPKKKPAVKKSSPKVKARKGDLGWPLKGRVVRSFSGKNGEASGIEIAAREGSAVKAAAAGKVIYSNDQIRGFGHLVILQHDNNLFTIYGFNKRNLVKPGSFVSQGQKIALSGRPPSGGPSRIHFEVRHGKTPVNPILYLP